VTTLDIIKWLGTLSFVIYACLRKDPNARWEAVKSALYRMPRAPIAEIVGGVVRVVGQVKPCGEAKRAPMSGRLCVAFELVVEEMRSSGRWKEILVHSQAGSFLVTEEKEMTAALVEPAGYLGFALMATAQPESGWAQAAAAEHAIISELLRAEGIGEDPWVSFRYRETVLEVGATVSIGGLATREVRPEGERGHLRAPTEMVVFHGTSAEPVRISDEVFLIEEVPGVDSSS
jgi:hypothetical protein